VAVVPLVMIVVVIVWMCHDVVLVELADLASSGGCGVFLWMFIELWCAAGAAEVVANSLVIANKPGRDGVGLYDVIAFHHGAVRDLVTVYVASDGRVGVKVFGVRRICVARGAAAVVVAHEFSSSHWYPLGVYLIHTPRGYRCQQFFADSAPPESIQFQRRRPSS
jgi:hypothetical protein